MDINREKAYKILLAVDEEKAFANILMAKMTGERTPYNPDLVRRLVYGVLEKRIYLDFFLEKLLTKGIAKTDVKTLNILRLGAYQMEFMDSVPDYAAIDTSVELAKKYCRGREGFVNGVLRNWQREKGRMPLPDKAEDYILHLSVRYSYAVGIVELLAKEVGEDRAEKILIAQGRNRPLGIRVNTNCSDVGTIIEELGALGIIVRISSLSKRCLIADLPQSTNITDLPAYKEGRISIQSVESCWISDLVAPQPGQRVLDLCAAPGGKTVAMAEMMDNQGEIVACDIYEHRCELIEGYARRCKIDIVKTICGDGRTLEFDNNDKFDRVLVDAPCSGLGVMNRKPDIKLREPDLPEIRKVQEELLRNAANLIRTGGRLVYSTCTMSRSENEDIVRTLTENGDFILIFEKQLYPDMDDRDGFYVAIMEQVRV